MSRAVRPTGTNYVAENLRFLLQQRRISQSELARATGLKQPTINRIRLGRNVRPLDRTLHPIARFFGVSLDDLRFKKLSDDTALLPYNLRGFRIPMVSAKNVGLKKNRDTWPDWVTVDYQTSDGAEMFEVVDDGMEPRIHRGDHVLSEPAIMPRPGNFVVARVEGEDDAIVRIYRALEYSEAKRDFELVPVNENFARIASRRAKVHIVGVAIERRERLI